MNTTTFSSLPGLAPAPAAARTALRMLGRLRHGVLTVQLPDGSIRVFGDPSGGHGAGRMSATMALSYWNVCAAALKSGDIGFAESYIAGDWTTTNLTDLLKLFIANRREVEDVIYGTWTGRALYRVKHWLHRNT